MGRNLWKQAICLLLALCMALSAVPATALAADGRESSLQNIAAECTITAPSAQGGREETNMVDGNTATMWVNDGALWPCTVEFKLPA